MANLEDVETNDLLRALYNETKEYLHFSFIVTNVGSVSRLKCTNSYKECNENTWNGYDFTLENSLENDEAIIYILRGRLKNIASSWTQNCYYYEWEQFLKEVGISQYNYNRLLKIEREY